MLTLRMVLCLSLVGLGLGLGLGGCYRPGDLGDTPYLCTNERPACPDGYVCAVSLGTCVRKSASSRRAITVPTTGPAAAAATSATGRVDGCAAVVGKEDLPEAEVEFLGDEAVEGGEEQDSENEAGAVPLGCGR